MTQPTFDSGLTASVNLNDLALDLSVITGASYPHTTGTGTRETMITLQIGRINIQTADPNWFRHLINQANAALISAGYHPHTAVAANDAGSTGEKETAA